MQKSRCLAELSNATIDWEQKYPHDLPNDLAIQKTVYVLALTERHYADALEILVKNTTLHKLYSEFNLHLDILQLQNLLKSNQE